MIVPIGLEIIEENSNAIYQLEGRNSNGAWRIHVQSAREAM
jgi:hypothetical protein